MKKGINRILAYQLSVSLSNDDLQSISGGNSNDGMTFHQSTLITANHMGSMDVSYDIRADV